MKWLLGIIVIAAVVAGLWWSGALVKLQTLVMPGTPPVAQQATTTPAAQPQAPLNGMSANNDASDAGIAQDTVAIDTQLQGLGSDSSSVDQSMNDKAVTQSY